MILNDHDKIFAYIRSYNNEKLLVINNFYGEECEFNLPSELVEELELYTGEILISNYKDSSKEFKKFTMRPYESIVYKLIK